MSYSTLYKAVHPRESKLQLKEWISLRSAQEPDFVDQEDEPEVTLPEGYDEDDFDDRKSESSDEKESPSAEVEETTQDSADNQPEDGEAKTSDDETESSAEEKEV